MSPQDLQDRELGTHRCRQPSSPGLLSYPRPFRTRTDSKGWAHLPWLHGPTPPLKSPPCGFSQRDCGQSPSCTQSLRGGMDHMHHQAHRYGPTPAVCPWTNHSLTFSMHARESGFPGTPHLRPAGSVAGVGRQGGVYPGLPVTLAPAEKRGRQQGTF